jgi:hypothetical protein
MIDIGSSEDLVVQGPDRQDEVTPDKASLVE